MPRFLVETSPVEKSDRDRALHLATQRFPEIAIEHRFTARDELGGRDLWVCRAPSQFHLERWAAAGRLFVGALEPVDDDASLAGA